jgi:hypothetical protein
MRVRYPNDADAVDVDSLLCNNCCVQLLSYHLIEWWAIQVNDLKVIPGNPHIQPSNEIPVQNAGMAKHVAHNATMSCMHRK